MVIILSLTLIGILLIAGYNITGFVINNTNTKNISGHTFRFILIIGTLGILTFLSRKKIKVSIEKVKVKIKTKYPKNSLKGLIKKQVYTEEGDYMGKVEEVFLEKNKINNLKVKLDKKQKFKIKGIIVKYKNIYF